jgi:Holliday junction resolvase
MIVNSIIKGIKSFFTREINVFRNNVGRIKNVSFGLAKGSGDLIGWKTITITPDMVGKKVGVFLSIEVKKKDKKIVKGSPQEEWLEIVNNAGGIAIQADSFESVILQVKSFKIGK